MRLKLKIRLLAIGAVIGLAACSESYPGMIYDDSGSKARNEEGLDSSLLVPLYVYVNKQSFFSVVATPGNGKSLLALAPEASAPSSPSPHLRMRMAIRLSIPKRIASAITRPTSGSLPSATANTPPRVRPILPRWPTILT